MCGKNNKRNEERIEHKAIGNEAYKAKIIININILQCFCSPFLKTSFARSRSVAISHSTSDALLSSCLYAWAAKVRNTSSVVFIWAHTHTLRLKVANKNCKQIRLHWKIDDEKRQKPKCTEQIFWRWCLWVLPTINSKRNTHPSCLFVCVSEERKERKRREMDGEQAKQAGSYRQREG